MAAQAAAASANKVKIGEEAFMRMEKVNSELLALTYGSLVVQLLRDLGSADAVNAQLDRMGYNIGIRIVEEFLARSGVGNRKCRDLAETAETIARVAFKMFLNIPAQVGPNFLPDKREFSIVFSENPLAQFVELPDSCAQLHFSNILCGVIRGALEMLQMRVECRFVRDTLHGDSENEIRVVLKEVLEEERPPDDDE